MKPLSQITAAEVMTRSVISARPDQDLAELERLLIERRISGVPVVEDGRLVGVISRSDIARVEVLMRSLDGQVSDELRWDDTQADGFQHAQEPEYQGFRRTIDRLKVRDAMRDQVITCTATTLLKDVATEMVRQHIHRIIVVEGKRAIGIISSLDVVGLVARYATTNASEKV